MRATNLACGIRKDLTALVLVLVSVFSVGSMAQELTASEPLPEASVVGPIQAVEENRQTLVVEGRRFSLGSRVNMDGVEFSREEVLERLSKGDEVTLHRESINQHRIERIDTNLQ